MCACSGADLLITDRRSPGVRTEGAVAKRGELGPECLATIECRAPAGEEEKDVVRRGEKLTRGATCATTTETHAFSCRSGSSLTGRDSR